MTFVLPTSPTAGQIISTLKDSYIWDGSKWVGYSGANESIDNNFVMVSRSGDRTALAPGNDIIFNNVESGAGELRTTYNTTTGVFTLRAGVTYELFSTVYLTSPSDVPNGFMYFGWYDATTNVMLFANNRGSGLATQLAPGSNNPVSRIIYTPTANQLVKLRTVNGTGTYTFRENGSICSVKQLGLAVTKYYEAGDWINAGPITIGATTTAPTKGTTVRDYARYRLVGPKIYEIEMQYYQTTGGTIGNGNYLFTLPAGLSFDSTYYQTHTGGQAPALVYTAIPTFEACGNYYGSVFEKLWGNPYSPTQFRLWQATQFVGSTYYNMSAANIGFNISMRIKAA